MLSPLTRPVASHALDGRFPHRPAPIGETVRYKSSNFNGLRDIRSSVEVRRGLRHHCKPIYTVPAFCYTPNNAPRIIGGKAQ